MRRDAGGTEGQMTIRGKYRLSLLIGIAGASVLALLMFHVSEYFLFVDLVFLIIVGGYVVNLKCPFCGKTVLKNEVRLFHRDFELWTPWIPKRCQRCRGEIE